MPLSCLSVNLKNENTALQPELYHKNQTKTVPEKITPVLFGFLNCMFSFFFAKHSADAINFLPARDPSEIFKHMICGPLKCTVVAIFSAEHKINNKVKSRLYQIVDVKP